MDELAGLAAQVCGAPMAVIGLVDERRAPAVEVVGVSGSDVGRDGTVCAAVTSAAGLVEVRDAREDGRFAGDPLVAGAAGVRLVAGVPLEGENGRVLGALCVMDRVVRDLTAEQREGLRLVGRQAARLVQLRQSVTGQAGVIERHQQAEAVLQAAFDHAVLGVSMTDAAGRILRVNERFARMLGRSADEVVGMTATDVTHPDDRAATREKIRQLIAGEVTTFVIEKRYVRKDGTWFWAQTSVSAARDAAGRPAGTVALVEDITERRRTREALAAAQRRVDSALIAGEVGTWVWEIDTDRLYGDENFARLFGIALDADGTAPLSRYVEAIHPDDREPVMRMIAEALETGRDYEAEYRVRLADGRERWVVARGKIERDASGRPVTFPGVLLDVTEARAARAALRESEERFRQLADAMPQMVFAATADGHVDYFNRKWYEYTGLPEGSVGFESWRHVHTEEGLRRVADVWPEALRTGSPYEIEYPLRRHDGVYRWHLGRALPIRNERGEVVRWFGTNTDIHDFKGLQAQKERLLESERAARAEAERANRTKDHFLAALSHELRTPLSPVLMTATAMESNPELPLQFRDDLQTIRRNVELEVQLIDDLLDVNRIASGKLRLKTEDVSLHELLRHVLEVCASDLLGKGLRILFDLRATRERVVGDAARLQQVFWNLLKNAIKFSTEGGLVTLRSRDVGPGRVRVEVTDNGAGIRADVLPRVFDAFEQGDASVTRQFGGLGLGLAISRGIVELHGGTITATSSGPGLGAEFAVELNTDAAPGGVGDGGRVAAVTPLAGDGTARPGLRILLAEDHPDTARSLSRLLARNGASVETAGTVAEAVRLAETATGAFDVLISDIGLPDGSGLELMRRVRPLGICGIALSGFGTDEDVRRSREAGFAEHLVKPVRFAELNAAIGRLVAARDLGK